MSDLRRGMVLRAFLNQLFKTNPTQPELAFYLIGKFGLEHSRFWSFFGKISPAVLSLIIKITILMIPSRYTAASMTRFMSRIVLWKVVQSTYLPHIHREEKLKPGKTFSPDNLGKSGSDCMP
eukprot:sb/3475942/